MKRQRSPLRNKNLLLGVTGSVAAYKAVELARRLKDEEAGVRVIMTPASSNFITPLSLELASRQKPIVSLWEEPLAHVNLASAADLFIVAPATANTLGRMAMGIADDALTACFMAYAGKNKNPAAPAIAAPAMNPAMYANPAFRRNLDFLKTGLGVIEVPPEEGPLACGATGTGRMAAVERIVDAARDALTAKDFQGWRVVVTAGPTREPIDPVRFISNRSSGRMGFALAKAAASRGASVVLVSGPVGASAVGTSAVGIIAGGAGAGGIEKFIRVETTAQMEKAVLEEAMEARLLIMAAAPADFTPEEPSSNKIIKTSEYDLKLRQTPDILLEVSKLEGKNRRRPFLVGFSAETGSDTGRAEEKLRRKGLDMIVFNDVTRPGAGFDCETNEVTIITRENGRRQKIPLMDKLDVAHEILDSVLTLKEPGFPLKNLDF